MLRCATSCFRPHKVRLDRSQAVYRDSRVSFVSVHEGSGCYTLLRGPQLAVSLMKPFVIIIVRKVKLERESSYQLLFFSPEALAKRKWHDKMQVEPYRSNVEAFVVDEAHVVKKW